MTLQVWTSRLSSRDPDALDVTRDTADAARADKRPAPGDAFAPSRALLRRPLAARAQAGQLRRDVRELPLFLRGHAAELHLVAAADLEAAAWEAYAPAYRAEMLESYRRRRAEWEALLARPRVVLVCFCTNPERCHRTLLAGFLGKLGADVRGELRA